MGILQEITLNSASRYNRRTCAKEADESLTRLRNTDCDDIEEWPSLVIETSLSESEAQLRADAYWWFSNSGFQVNMVILFHIQRFPKRRVIVKLYSLRPTIARITRGLQAEAQRTLHSDPASPQTVSPTLLAKRLSLPQAILRMLQWS